MTDPLILSVDLGTTGPKVALMNLEGKIICSARNNVPFIYVDSNGVEQDPNHWWVAIDQAISWVLMKSIEHKKDIIGISTTSHWSSCVFLDKDQKIIDHSIICDDSRGAQAIKKLNKTLLPIAGYAPRKLWYWIRKSGGAPRLSGQDSLAHLLYLKDVEPKKFEQIHYVLEPKDYINYRLTGEIRVV